MNPPKTDMKTKLFLCFALVLGGGLIGSAIWLMQKSDASPSAAVRQAYWSANAGNYSRADDFLLPPFLNAITNVPHNGSTRRFWNYYTRTQTIERVNIGNETITNPTPAATPFATVLARVEFKNGQTRTDFLLLAQGVKKRWQIYMVKDVAKPLPSPP